MSDAVTQQLIYTEVREAGYRHPTRFIRGASIDKSFRRSVYYGAIDIGVGPNLFPERAAQQLVNGDAGRFALRAPKRLLQGARGRRPIDLWELIASEVAAASH